MVHTRTHVDLYDPWVEILVDHKIISNHLEEPFFASDTSLACFDAPDNNILDFFLKSFPLIFSYIFAKSLHIPHALIDDSSFMIFLNGIVSEMLEFIMNIVETVVISTKPEIALLVKPNDWRIEVLDENPLSDVKFFTIYQQRIFDIFLDYKLAIFTKTVICNIIEVIHAFDASTS